MIRRRGGGKLPSRRHITGCLPLGAISVTVVPNQSHRHCRPVCASRGGVWAVRGAGQGRDGLDGCRPMHDREL